MFRHSCGKLITYLEHRSDVFVVHSGGEVGDDVRATLHQRLGSGRHVLHLRVIQNLPLLLGRDRIRFFHLENEILSRLSIYKPTVLVRFRHPFRSLCFCS